TAEVTDASRRTIDASGQVIAARRPFRIYTWLDRGHYRVGDPIVAHFQARTSDGSPVQGEGTVELLRVTYGADRKPSEKLVQSWPVKTDQRGMVDQKLEAEAGGQYRIRLVLKSTKGQEEEGASLFTIRGPGDRADDFRFEGLQLIPDKSHYQPGETMRLQINSDRTDARVALFVRAGNGASPKPQWIDLKEKTAIVDVKIETRDQPNFFVDAFTVHDGQVLEVTREILVPPEQRMLDLQVQLDRVEYLPGGEAVAQLQLLDAKGQPVEGNTVIAVYDRSLEAIAGDVLPGDIREYFWKWRRNHWSDRADNLAWQTWPIPIGPVQWTPLGIFGWQIDQEAASQGGPVVRSISRYSSMRGVGGPGGMGGMGGRMGGFGGGGPMVADAMMAAPAPMAGAMAKNQMAETSGAMADGAAPASGGETPAVAVRKDFADSALWIAAVPFDANGKGTIRFKMPENLTSWKLKTWAIGPRLAVGSAETQAVTRKPLLVRLQAPRFLVERDRVAIAAIVQNDLPKDQEVEVRLEIDGQTQLDLVEGEKAVRKVKVAAGGQERIDFLCRAVAEGTPKVRVFATAADGQDATELTLPVLVRGFLLTDSFAGTLRGQQREGKANLVVPEKRRSDQSRLVVRVSPSLAAAMVDALPYLADYPYGCTEQTLNRFLPTVITRKTLQQMQVDLASLAKERANLNAQEIGNAADRAKQWKRWPREAVY
ncbi:MAG: alpha-2-macroglobulin family protein, partial [Pirellulaceae bacterium]